MAERRAQMTTNSQKATEITDQYESIVQLLTALEYGGAKEDELIAELLSKYSHPRTEKEALAKLHHQKPGFEPFFLDVIREVRPFALMVKEIYELLSLYESTAERRASLFWISSAGAESVLDFDMAAFPRDVMRLITEIQVTMGTLQLEFGSVEEQAESFPWNGSETSTLWCAINPVWDGDFYDNGFHRLLSDAGTFTPHGSVQRQRVEEFVEPILDRLKALCATLTWDELGLYESQLKAGFITSWMNGESEELLLALYEPEHFQLDHDSTLEYLHYELLENQYGGVALDTSDHELVLDKVSWTLFSISVAISVWQQNRPR